MDLSRPNLNAFPNSPYAAELAHISGGQLFSLELEAQYARARLLGNRTLIRVACTLAVLVVLSRAAQHLLAGTWDQAGTGMLAVVLTSSLVLMVLAWSRQFDQWYLPFAQWLVPLRNAVAAIAVAAAASVGHIEVLMVLTLMVLGPFFFLGLPTRVAAVTALLTIVSFVASGLAHDLDLQVMLRACVLLLLAAGGCSIAARHVDRWSRRSFLESRLIAELAQHDALTGLKNRRVFDEHLEALWERAIADSRTLAILIIDVDHFKAYNDIHGHQAGDRALQQVAGRLEQIAAGPGALLARYGGEEFAATFYDADHLQARDIAERMRQAVSELDIEHRGSQLGTRVTISVGVAVVQPSHPRRPRGALQLADQALYQAKVNGRNRVELMDSAAHGQLVTGVFPTISTVEGHRAPATPPQ